MQDFSAATLAPRGAGGACGRRRARLAPRGGAQCAPGGPWPRPGAARHGLHVFSRRMQHLLTAPADAACALAPGRKEKKERGDERVGLGRAAGERFLRCAARVRLLRVAACGM